MRVVLFSETGQSRIIAYLLIALFFQARVRRHCEKLRVEYSEAAEAGMRKKAIAAAAPRDDDDLDLNDQTIKHGSGWFPGEPVARCEKIMKICDYAGLTRMAVS